MITLILSITLFTVFTVLGLLHFYWTFGGKIWLKQSLPTTTNGKIVLNPRWIDCAIVGIGLSSFGLFYLIQSGFVFFTIPSWISLYGGWIIPAIFILRAIGDFRYVGFFKSIRETSFGKLDSKFFSPLCILIGTIGILIQLNI